jgi:hypothetical protein
VNGREEADWQRRVNFSAAVARAKFPLGSEEESRAIRQHYEANRGRFCGDYAAAQREYRAKQGIIL